MSVANSHLKLKMRFLSQEAQRNSNISSLNHTKYSSSINEINKTAHTSAYFPLSSSQCNKMKSKFLKMDVNQASMNEIKAIKPFQPSRGIKSIDTFQKPSLIFSPISYTKRGLSNCLNIMKHGLTERNVHNSLLITIAAIKKKQSQTKKKKRKIFLNTNLQSSKFHKQNNTNANVTTTTTKSYGYAYQSDNETFRKYLTHDLKYKLYLPFSLVNSHQFPPENRLIHDLEIANYDEINSLAIKKTIKDNFKIEGTVHQTANEIIHHEKRKTNQLLVDKFIRVLIRAAIDFQQLHISLEEFYTNQYTILSPFQFKDSRKLIINVKQGNSKEVIKLIADNKYLVRDFDYFHLTALHWAAKRNIFKVISHMVFVGANVNSQDCLSRTPLHYASINNHVESMLVLLYEMALPAIKDNSGQTPADYTNNYKLNYMLHRAATLHILHDKGKQKNWKNNIRIGLLYCFINDLKLLFNLDRFNIIETKDK